MWHVGAGSILRVDGGRWTWDEVVGAGLKMDGVEGFNYMME